MIFVAELNIYYAFGSIYKRKVKNFIDKTNILVLLKEVGKTKHNYILFSKYMEALIAFHKYYGGKEQ